MTNKTPQPQGITRATLQAVLAIIQKARWESGAIDLSADEVETELLAPIRALPASDWPRGYVRAEDYTGNGAENCTVLPVDYDTLHLLGTRPPAIGEVQDAFAAADGHGVYMTHAEIEARDARPQVKALLEAVDALTDAVDGNAKGRVMTPVVWRRVAAVTAARDALREIGDTTP